MKRLILAALVALPFAFLGQKAQANGDACSPTFRLGFSLGLAFKGWAGCDSCGGGGCGGGGCGPCTGCSEWGGGGYPGCGPGSGCGGGGCGGCNQCGYAAPWYQYWPMEAYFQHPAPTGFPFYGPMAPPGGYAGPAAHQGGYPGVPPAGYYGAYRGVAPAGYYGAYPGVAPAAYYPSTGFGYGYGLPGYSGGW